MRYLPRYGETEFGRGPYAAGRCRLAGDRAKAALATGPFRCASGNERFFLNRPHSIGLRRKGDFRRLSCIPKMDDLPEMRTRSLLRQTRSFLVLAMFLTVTCSTSCNLKRAR